MTIRVRVTLSISAFFLFAAAPALGQESEFDRTIAPLLIERCIDCHSGPKPKGKLDLTKKASAAKVLVPGKPGDSDLWKRVEAGEMPPKKPLPAKEKVILKQWIDSGAVWGADPIDPFRFTNSKRAGYDWWSLQPVKRPAVPAVKQTNWPRNPIDRFILAKLEAEGLTPSPEADARTLTRRLYFDLIGLPPDPKDLPRSPLGLVDELLKSPRHGERWARHWLDIVRFGESHGFEHDEIRRNAWPYRDWVIQAINRDMPYDVFARLQIAGDVLKTDDPSAITATGFLVAGGYDSVGQGQQSAPMKAVVRQDELEDIVGTIGQTFLGLTVQCARCHDHKFDPVRAREYYRLTAAVAGVRHGERNITNPDLNLAQAKRLAASQKELASLRADLAALETPIRARILAGRKKEGKSPKVFLPKPVVRFDFTKSLKDEITGLEVKLHNGAIRKSDGLHLRGNSAYASTPAYPKAIAAKTLAVVVQLDNLAQRGGAALSVQSLDGHLFDAIVFGERQAGRWMPGSDGFRRTRDVGGRPEIDAVNKPVHVAITYRADGVITVYRNGIAYGKPYNATGFLSFEATKAMLLFGLRHSPVGGNKHLTGTILRAELYERALPADEIAALAGGSSDYVSDAEIVSGLDEAMKKKRDALLRLMAQAGAKQGMEAPAARVYAVVPRVPEPTYLLNRGSLAEKGALLTPGGVASLKVPDDFGLPANASDADRRKKLAEWITHPKNPLFARVMVNRLWHYHFGVGLVDTPSDFGFNGGRPSHPELLDWLAAEFMHPTSPTRKRGEKPDPTLARGTGWSMRHIHRLIVNSATYRQSSRFRPDAARRDANNRWLWRFSPHRLEAEALRDSILSVAGALNLQQGGPGYQDFKLTVRGATHYYNPIDTDDPALYRRSIYRTWARSGRNGLLDAHDCPDPSTVSPRRAVTTTPLQALALMNNAFVLRMADRFAERLRKEAGNDIGKQIARAYEVAYARSATVAEIGRARPVIERHGLAAFCRAVFNSNEFVYVD
ncbi:MAG: DUF1553 domain-containing protein [Planctomycetes bacterium]|nr:DUF1553 domain-containing protein [Planctomycetota bacterium]